MITLSDGRSFTDIPLGTLTTEIKSYEVDEVEITINFNEGIDPLPDPESNPYLFVIGNLNTSTNVDKREQVQCIEKISDSKYVIRRDPLNSGLILKEHLVGEIIYFTTLGGNIINNTLGSLSIISNNSLRFLDEILFSLFGYTNVVDIFNGKYSSFFEISIEIEDNTYVLINSSPGSIFVNEDNGIVHTLVVSEEDTFKSQSITRITLEELLEKTPLYIYINNVGSLSYCFESEPDDVFSDSGNNVYLLGKIINNTLNQLEPIVEDLRPDSLRFESTEE